MRKGTRWLGTYREHPTKCQTCGEWFLVYERSGWREERPCPWCAEAAWRRKQPARPKAPVCVENWS